MNIIKIIFFISISSLLSCDSENTPLETELIGEIEWQKTIGGTSDDVARGIIETTDRGYAVIGYTKSIDGDITDKTVAENDFWVIKLDLNGNIEWQKTYGGSGDDKGRAIIQTNDGGFAITGPSMSADGDASQNQGFHDHWLVKLDSQGFIQWEKSFGFAGHDHSHSLFQTKDGGYFLGGYLDVTASEGAGNETFITKHGIGEFWAQKLDANGNLQWRRYYGGTNNDRIYKVLEAHDSNFLLVGSSESNDFDISDSNGSYDVWVIKIDTEGTMLWQKSYGGSGIENGHAAIATNDGNYIIAGTAISDDGLISSPKGNADIWVIKINDRGELLWERSFGGSGFDSAFAISKSNSIFSSYIIAGHSKSSDGDLSVNNGENDYWVFQIDTNGKLLFEKSLGGAGLDFAYGVTETFDGKIVVVGETESSDNDISQNKGGKDIWIAKIR
ncbi:MAG: hypothetical protein HKN90_00775 [Flavobacteriaceae bacterium]|nr:hypothetical protein [Flavobacteriaceae bacterium]